MSKKTFKSGTTYTMGVPDLGKSTDRNNPIFLSRVRKISVTGNQLRAMGIRSLPDLASIAINPPLSLNRTYWCYEIEDDGSLRFVGEFTVLAQLSAVQAGQRQPSARYAGIPLDQQEVGMTTLGDAMDESDVAPASYHEYRAKFEAAQEHISSLQDAISALRDDRSSEVDRLTTSLREGHEQQLRALQTQLESATARIEQLYKQLEEKDRKIFSLQQDIVEMQQRMSAATMKAQFQRDFERSQRAIERQNEKASGGGMNDLLSLFGAVAPFVLGDKTKPVAATPLSDPSAQTPKPRPVTANNLTGQPPIEMAGAVRQPVAGRNGSPAAPPPVTIMPPPRRVILPQEQDAIEIHDAGSTVQDTSEGEQS